MKFTSVLAIYALFWWMCLFLVLPFRLQSRRAVDRHVPGQADSAPPRFSVWRTAFWTTIVSGGAFAAFYLNYVEGWIGVEALDLFR
jgi:predicted secreted protein